MIFDADVFDIYLSVMISGTFAGFTIGFITWALGFAVYELIHFFKMA
jgi:hypothetical protein